MAHDGFPVRRRPQFDRAVSRASDRRASTPQPEKGAQVRHYGLRMTFRGFLSGFVAFYDGIERFVGLGVTSLFA